jgi:hypothetical protein
MFLSNWSESLTSCDSSSWVTLLRAAEPSSLRAKVMTRSNVTG